MGKPMQQAGRARQSNARHEVSFGVFLVLAMLLAGIGLGTAISPVPVEAAGATFTVTTAADGMNNATCTATCTLRQAVNASNANDPGTGNANTIAFSATFNTARTITLSSAANFGTLTLTRSVTIIGPGAALLTVDGGCTDCGAGRANTSGTGVGVFAVNSAITVALSNLTIANGDAGNNGGVIANTGGAIANNGGAITVTNCAFTNNLASSTVNGGGAIFNNGPLTITNSTFTGNVSGFLGGAIESVSNSVPITLAVTGSTFTGNQAAGDGGAIDNNVDSTATITASTFTGNTAANGGNAITNISLFSNFPARLTLVNSTLSGNVGTSTTIGGAISSSGGAATTVIAGSTISGNTSAANNSTAGVLVLGGSTITLTDTISAGNIFTGTGTGGSPDLFSNTGALFTGRNNIIGVGTGTNFSFLIDGGDGNQVGNAARPRNPLLAPLASNGGPVQTRALLPGSLAIDTGACAYADATGTAQTLATDARGVSRPQGAGCDVGSYELVIAPPTSFVVNRAADDMADANCTPASCTLRQIVNAANATDPGPGNTNTITFDPAVFATPQTITLSSMVGFGTLTLRRPLTITGPGAALLTVDGGCTDCGAGKANTSNTGVTVFAVNPGIAASFSGLTIANGDAARVDSVLNGGAISNGGGAVTVRNGAFANNRSVSGGAIYNNAGTVTVTSSAFTGNEADSNGSGGAIVSIGTNSPPGVLAITGSTFTGNQAGDSGAIANEQNSTTTITASTFIGNMSPFTGAISNSSGGDSSTPARLTLVNSTLSGNTSTGTFAGGFRTNGNGILVNGGDGSALAIVGSTISGNTAAGNFGTGGVYASFPGGTITITDTILAGNTVTDTTTNLGSSPDLLYEFNGSTQPFSGTNNVIGVGDASTDFSGLANGTNGNQVGTAAAPLNPLLATLSNYGGPVQTRALLPGSPAIDTGACAYTDATGTAGTLTTDARGIARSQGAACDVGAFESRGFLTSALTGNGQNALINAAFASPVGLTVSSAFNEPVAGGQITYTITPGAGGARATFPAASGCTLMSTTVAICPIATTTGIATSPPFTANGTAGSFTIFATTRGVSSTTTFTETNTTSVGTGTAPTTVADTATVTTGLSVSISVLANDTPGTPAATITAVGTPLHGTATISGVSITYTPTGSFTGTDTFTYTISNSAGSSTATVTVTVNAAATPQLTGLITTAPTGTGSGNTGSPGNPTIPPGAVLTLNTTGTYSNNTSGPVSGLTYTGSNPTVASVDANGVVRAFVPGQITVTVTGPNGTRTTITVTVTMATGSGLVPPAPAPMVHGAAPPAAATPLPQPMTHPVGNGTSGGVGPRAAGSATATPAPQPARH